MLDLLKNIIYTYKNNKADRHYRSFFALLVYAGVGTLIYTIMFFVYGYLIIAAILFACTVLFVITFLIFNRGMVNLALLMAFVCVFIAVVSSVVLTGIECGAQFYLLGAVILFVLTEFTEKSVKYLCAVLSLAAYFALYILGSKISPIYVLPDFTMLLINQVNTIASFGAVVYTSFSYRSAVKVYEKELTAINSEATYLANYDQLTGLENRRYIYQQLNALISKSNENNLKFVVGMADIDDFKAINDQYGHLYGDEILVETSRLIKKALRKNDVVGRWGGEEFLIILPDTSLEKGIEILERVKSSVSETPVIYAEARFEITMTIGVVEFMKNIPQSELIRLADERMYLGKNRGKNRIVSSEGALD